MHLQDSLAPWPMSSVSMINCLHIYSKAFVIEVIRYMQSVDRVLLEGHAESASSSLMYLSFNK